MNRRGFFALVAGLFGARQSLTEILEPIRIHAIPDPFHLEFPFHNFDRAAMADAQREFNQLKSEYVEDLKFFRGDVWPVGSTIHVKMPYRLNRLHEFNLDT